MRLLPFATPEDEFELGIEQPGTLLPSYGSVPSFSIYQC